MTKKEIGKQIEALRKECGLSTYELEQNKMNELIKITGADLKRLREEKGLTARQLSEKIGVSVNYIYMCESGRKNLSLATIQRICKALKVDARIIFR